MKSHPIINFQYIINVIDIKNQFSISKTNVKRNDMTWIWFNRIKSGNLKNRYFFRHPSHVLFSPKVSMFSNKHPNSSDQIFFDPFELTRSKSVCVNTILYTENLEKLCLTRLLRVEEVGELIRTIVGNALRSDSAYSRTNLLTQKLNISTHTLRLIQAFYQFVSK